MNKYFLMRLAHPKADRIRSNSFTHELPSALFLDCSMQILSANNPE